MSHKSSSSYLLKHQTTIQTTWKGEDEYDWSVVTYCNGQERQRVFIGAQIEAFVELSIELVMSQTQGESTRLSGNLERLDAEELSSIQTEMLTTIHSLFADVQRVYDEQERRAKLLDLNEEAFGDD